jgi:uroporphyrinogen-III synthase
VEIIVTRPEHQAQSLCKQLVDQGFRVRALPLLVIKSKPIQLPHEPVDGWIFISPNAVNCLAQESPSALAKLTASTQVYAIGESTAKHLKRQGVSQVVYPRLANSEALLALPELESVENQRIMLVCGEGGRDLIESVLKQRGAEVQRLEVYRREPNADLYCQLTDEVSPSLWIISSAAALAVLNQLTPRPQRLLVTSKRLAQLAEQQHHQVVAISDSALDQDIVTSLSRITAG